MCGIFGYVGKRKDAGKIVLSSLKLLEYRGYDSWGIAQKKGESIDVKKNIGKITDVNLDLIPSDIALGHTRWATHGGVTIYNAHPHLDCGKRLAIIHNGIIENYVSFKSQLSKNGHNFISETDTEVAIHIIEELLNKGQSFREAVRLTFKQFEGLNAIIVMDIKTQTFVAVKNGSPLVIGEGKGENFISSDAPALINYTNKVHFMEDEEVVELKASGVRAYTLKEGKVKEINWQKLNWHFNEVNKGKYPHFMIKEIYDQLKVIKSISEGDMTQIKDLSEMVDKAYGTYMVACGTASYAALEATYLFSKIANRHINFAVGSEFGYQLDFLKEKSLIIALSQSGETIDVIDAVKKAKQKGATIYTLVNTLGSTLYRMADYKILLQAGPEKAVASTKAFTAKLAYLILLAYTMDNRSEEGRRHLNKAAVSMENILNKEAQQIKKIAKSIANKDHIFVIGRGLAYPIALETALKIKEVSYIHAEGMASGELKHGPIALVEKDTPCIAFLPNDETYGANLAGAMEMKARGGMIIGISYENHEIFDHYINVVDASEASIIPETVVAQLLAYFLAVEKGLDPDKPRNLAKSVTVK